MSSLLKSYSLIYSKNNISTINIAPGPYKTDRVKELVKYINGWQWNASERKWYFERKDDTFNELKKFEKYASKFEFL